MSNLTLQTIDAIAKERGVEREVVVAAIEEALRTASRKYYKNNEDLHARCNVESGQIELFAVKAVVETVQDEALEISLVEALELCGDEAQVGMDIEFPRSTDVLGRIAAQTFKQVLSQKVREAERENIFAEYSQRVGEVVSGTVKRFETGDLIVEIGRIEAILPKSEQSRAESYSPGDRVRAVIRKVDRSAKGPQIVLSRRDPALLIKLFEQEVPEIYDAAVVVKGAVREAGDRAKVAVFSRDRDVDPVGACVGMKGTRVQAIIRELRGEKIDIVEWSDDSVLFVTNALSPAKVQRVSIVDDHERVMEVVVEDKQLSLAIGKKGQNVRLAAKLTGWRIDIKSEEEKRREVEAQFEGLEFGAYPAEPGEEGASAEMADQAGEAADELPAADSVVGDADGEEGLAGETGRDDAAGGEACAGETLADEAVADEGIAPEAIADEASAKEADAERRKSATAGAPEMTAGGGAAEEAASGGDPPADPAQDPPESARSETGG